jgi:hypothetical protein
MVWFPCWKASPKFYNIEPETRGSPRLRHRQILQSIKWSKRGCLVVIRKIAVEDGRLVTDVRSARGGLDPNLSSGITSKVLGWDIPNFHALSRQFLHVCRSTAAIMACSYSLDDADQGIAIWVPCIRTITGTESYMRACCNFCHAFIPWWGTRS